jgi:hypothetical protein
MITTAPDKLRIALPAVYLAHALALGAAACATGPAASDGTGQVQMALQIAPGVSLTSAAYTIAGPSGFTSNGTVSVGQTADVPVVLGGLPAGTGYTLTVTGTASDGATVCSGSTGFDVGTNARTTVIVHLACRQPPPTGAVLVNGTTNVCPVLDGIAVLPAEAYVGATIALHAVAHDSDGAPSPLTYAWTASGGALAGASLPDATFTCTAAGTTTLTAAVSDGDAACTDSLSVTVTCTVHP